MILVDSSVWIDHFRDTLGPETLLFRKLPASGPAELAVGDLVQFEVLGGVPDLRLELIVRTAMLGVMQVELAGLAATNDAVAPDQAMRRCGVTPGSVDTFNAAWCLRERCPLLTRDGDFLPMRDHPGLELVDPVQSGLGL